MGRLKAWRWIYRIGASRKVGRHRVARFLVAPESALGSVPTVALSSAQVMIVVAWAEPNDERSSRHCCSNSKGVR